MSTLHAPQDGFVFCDLTEKYDEDDVEKSRVDWVYERRKSVPGTPNDGRAFGFVDRHYEIHAHVLRLRQPCLTTRHPTGVYSVTTQLLWLLILGFPVASVAWTITHEEVFREARDYCKNMSEPSPGLLQRKFFYLFTCEYCFSHYVAAVFLLITRFKLLYPGCRGYLIAWLALVWLSNVYMAVFANIRLEIHHERLEIKFKDLDLQSQPDQLRANRAA